MRIAILGQPRGWHVSALLEAAERIGVEARAVDFRKLHARLGDDCSVLKLGDFDLLQADRVLIRTVPPGSLEQIVFRMDALHRLQAAGVPVLNPPAAIEACVDKYLAVARLQQAGLPIPATAVCEGLDDAMQAFRDLGGDVVVKPLFGSEGRGIFRVSDEALAYRALRTLTTLQSAIYLQRFVDHPGYDVRCFVIGDNALAAMKRIGDGDFRTNVALGGRFEPILLSDRWRAIAVRAAQAVGAPVAGVDLLPDRDGNVYVIEVNSTPGFQALSQTTSVDIARETLRFLLRADWPGQAGASREEHDQSPVSALTSSPEGR